MCDTMNWIKQIRVFTNGNSDWKLAPTTICTPHSIFIFSSSSVTVCIALNSILSLSLSLCLSPDFTQLSPVHIDTQPHKHFTSALRPFFRKRSLYQHSSAISSSSSFKWDISLRSRILFRILFCQTPTFCHFDFFYRIFFLILFDCSDCIWLFC